MKAVIFTHPPDYVAAGLAARALRGLGVRPILAIDRKDPKLAVEGCTVVRTSAPRQGNLNGTAWVREALRTMHAAGAADYVLKVDSDTIVRGLGWLEGPACAAAGVWVPAMSGMNGCCYALGTGFLDEMIRRADLLPESAHCPEDRTIGKLAAECGPVRYQTYGEPGCVFSAWLWAEGMPKYGEDRSEVIVFNRENRVPRDEQAAAMKRFLQ